MCLACAIFWRSKGGGYVGFKVGGYIILKEESFGVDACRETLQLKEGNKILDKEFRGLF